MNTKTLEKFEALNSEMLARVEGGGCNWGDFAKSGIAGGAGNGLRLGIKTRTWQGVVAGAVGGAIIGGVGYGATCWW
ncbi:Blp family class II bacteriocin [Streptococcus constellatus]|uniref:Bacteriocin n=3 Tax=Streptococcus constellatus TaxID=76860 RepID=A0A0C1K5J0_STRCV|nr:MULTISPECIES: Blp family class II bacteriocin [Streptococcus]AQS79430.1 hypothetical BlpU class IIc bacteriocin [Streptococcus constellatus subsp. constellatus]AQS79437.1 hypothetical BlpU class IIc bacteriocin [Streptococcus constellatus subsp. constellatus]AQS79481.1 hypothetical BlpU class IIc bacteriocin [Streptococcus constellatus]EID20034.1 bacteriocin class II with double-glycine leader peptide [Streptococcus constellatus subsp. constellatus SK53]KIC78295.1 bacteriocin [Streptococcus